MLALPLLAKPESPNFVVVYMDDLGWADTSVPMIEGREETRSDFYQTPGLQDLIQHVLDKKIAELNFQIC